MFNRIWTMRRDSFVSNDPMANRNLNLHQLHRLYLLACIVVAPALGAMADGDNAGESSMEITSIYSLIQLDMEFEKSDK